MLNQTKKLRSKSSRMGQSMVEYILVFVAVVVVLMAALGPNGMFTKKVEESLNTSVKGIDLMVNEVTF